MNRAIGLLLLAAASLGQAPAGPPPSAQSPGADTHADRAILVISYDDPGQASVQELVQGYQEVLVDAEMPPRLYLEFFDQVRFAQATYPQEFYQWLIRKYRDRRIDVIVTVQQRALQLLAEQPAGPWQGLPVVYGVLGDLTIDVSKSLPRATGVILENHFPAALQAIKTLLPDTRRVALIYGASAAERERTLWFVPQVAGAGLDVLDLSALTIEDVLARVAQLPAGTVPLFIEFQQDGMGRTFNPARACQLISAAANRPLFGLSRSLLGCGIVGGPLMDLIEGGRVTARQALKRIGPEPGETVRVPVAQHAPLVFDARELTRWGISESRLPAGSTVLFRPASLWRDYRGVVIGALVVGAVQTMLIVAVLLERGRRTRAQAALSKSFQHLQDLAGRLVTAEEQERTRIARDLHDDFGQRVASLSMGLSIVRHRMPVEESELCEQLSALQQRTITLSNDLRQLSHDLHPGTIKDVGLVDALRGHFHEISAEAGIDVRLDVSDKWSELPDVVATCLYRVAQEALRNITRHAQATTASVSLGQENGQVVMRVTDDGLGFDQTARTQGAGLGLVSLDERVRMLGGTFDIRTSENVGTTLAVTLPVEQPRPA